MGDARIQRRERVAFRELEEGAGAVLLDLDTGAYRRLNQVGMAIWTLLEERPTRDELVEALRARIVDAPPDLGDHVDAFLAALRERGLVTDVPDAKDAPPGTGS